MALLSAASGNLDCSENEPGMLLKNIFRISTGTLLSPMLNPTCIPGLENRLNWLPLLFPAWCLAQHEDAGCLSAECLRILFAILTAIGSRCFVDQRESARGFDRIKRKVYIKIRPPKVINCILNHSENLAKPGIQEPWKVPVIQEVFLSTVKYPKTERRNVGNLRTGSICSNAG